MFKVIKFGLNIAGLIWMLILGHISYGLIVKFPSCDKVMSVIWSNLQDLLSLYLVYCIIATLLNLVIERKLEKQKTSKEYLSLLFGNVLFLIVGAVMLSYNFYIRCGEAS